MDGVVQLRELWKPVPTRVRRVSVKTILSHFGMGTFVTYQHVDVSTKPKRRRPEWDNEPQHREHGVSSDSGAPPTRAARPPGPQNPGSTRGTHVGFAASATRRLDADSAVAERGFSRSLALDRAPGLGGACEPGGERPEAHVHGV